MKPLLAPFRATAQLLTQARTKQGIGRGAMAKKLGISLQFLGRIENGRVNPPYPTLYKTVLCYDISWPALHMALLTDLKVWLDREYAKSVRAFNDD